MKLVGAMSENNRSQSFWSKLAKQVLLLFLKSWTKITWHSIASEHAALNSTKHPLVLVHVIFLDFMSISPDRAIRSSVSIRDLIII
jgi:hypothetical protein